MSGLIKTIGTIFDPVLNFFLQIWDIISTFLSFIWDLITGIYYGFNTIIDHVWSILSEITGLSFFSDSSGVVANLFTFLGVGSITFMSILLIAVFLVILRFIYSLIPFFHK